jgi:hypothetical protein
VIRRFRKSVFACVRLESLNSGIAFIRGLLSRKMVFEGPDFDYLYFSFLNIFLSFTSAPEAPPNWPFSVSDALETVIKALQHSIIVRAIDRVFLHSKGIDPQSEVTFTVANFTFEYCGLTKRFEKKLDGIHFGYREFTTDSNGETLRYVKTLHRNMYLTFRILFRRNTFWPLNNLEEALFNEDAEIKKETIGTLQGIKKPRVAGFPDHLPFLQTHFESLLSSLYTTEHFEVRAIADEIEANEFRCLNEGFLYFVLHSIGLGFEPQLQMGSLSYGHRFVSIEAIHDDMTLLEDRLPSVEGRIDFILLKLVSLSYVLAVLDLHPKNVAVDAELNIRIFDCFLNEMYDTNGPTFLRGEETNADEFGAHWKPFVKLLLRDKTSEMKQFIIDFVDNVLISPKYHFLRWLFLEDYGFMNFEVNVDRAVVTYLDFLHSWVRNGVSRYIEFPIDVVDGIIRRSAECIKLRFARLVKRAFIEFPATVEGFEAEFLTVQNTESLARLSWVIGKPGIVFTEGPAPDDRVCIWSENARVQELFESVARLVPDGIPLEFRRERLTAGD